MRKISINLIRIILTMAVLLSFARSARAQFLNSLKPDLQLEYDYLQSKLSGGGVSTDSYASFNYNLSFHRPITPGMSMWTDLTLIASQTGDYQTGQQTAQGVIFNLFWNQPEYTFMSRINTDRYTTDFSEPIPTLTTGRTSTYSTGVLLRMPAYPLVSIQYQGEDNTSNAGSASSTYSTNAWQLSSQYYLRPLQFTYDGQNQTTSSGGVQTSQTTIQRSAVAFDYSLLSNLDLNAQLSRTDTGSQNWGTTNTNAGQVRLTAQPTSAVSATVALQDQVNTEPTVLGPNSANSRTLSLDVRTQFLPRVGIEYTDQVQDQHLLSDGVASDYSTWNSLTELSARLTNATIFQAGLTESGSAPQSQPQSSLQCGLLTRLRPTTDLSLNIGNDRLVSDAQDWNKDTQANISLRDRTTTRLSLGATYRWDGSQSQTSPDPEISQQLNQFSLDALWQPAAGTSINLQLGWFTDMGSLDSSSLEPGVNFRWRIGSHTDLAADYNLTSSNVQNTIGNSTFEQQQNNTASVNLTHTFLDGSRLNILYNYLNETAGSSEWQKQFQVQYTMRY
ncbi:MAG: hypothetical protein ACLQVD_12655 [Capsulimonadaceae bacterium]